MDNYDSSSDSGASFGSHVKRPRVEKSSGEHATVGQAAGYRRIGRMVSGPHVATSSVGDLERKFERAVKRVIKRTPAGLRPVASDCDYLKRLMESKMEKLYYSCRKLVFESLPEVGPEYTAEFRDMRQYSKTIFDRLGQNFVGENVASPQDTVLASMFKPVQNLAQAYLYDYMTLQKAQVHFPFLLFSLCDVIRGQKRDFADEFIEFAVSRIVSVPLMSSDRTNMFHNRQAYCCCVVRMMKSLEHLSTYSEDSLLSLGGGSKIQPMTQRVVLLASGSASVVGYDTTTEALVLPSHIYGVDLSGNALGQTNPGDADPSSTRRKLQDLLANRAVNAERAAEAAVERVLATRNLNLTPDARQRVVEAVASTHSHNVAHPPASANTAAFHLLREGEIAKHTAEARRSLAEVTHRAATAPVPFLAAQLPVVNQSSSNGVPPLSGVTRPVVDPRSSVPRAVSPVRVDDDFSDSVSASTDNDASSHGSAFVGPALQQSVHRGASGRTHRSSIRSQRGLGTVVEGAVRPSISPDPHPPAQVS